MIQKLQKDGNIWAILSVDIRIKKQEMNYTQVNMKESPDKQTQVVMVLLHLLIFHYLQ